MERVHPYEVAPHDVELDQTLELGKVKDGLGSDSTGEAVSYVHLPQAVSDKPGFYQSENPSLLRFCSEKGSGPRETLRLWRL